MTGYIGKGRAVEVYSTLKAENNIPIGVGSGLRSKLLFKEKLHAIYVVGGLRHHDNIWVRD